MNRERLAAQLFMLRATITCPWESVDQLLREHADRSLGDASVPRTGTWHLRHIVEIFRLHARTTMLGLGAEPAAVEDLVQRPDAAIAALPQPARDGLLSELDAFSAWTSGCHLGRGSLAPRAVSVQRIRRLGHGSVL